MADKDEKDKGKSESELLAEETAHGEAETNDPPPPAEGEDGGPIGVVIHGKKEGER